MATAFVTIVPLRGRAGAPAASLRPATEVIVLSQGVNGYAGATDTWVDSAHPSTNYGNQAQLEVHGAGEAGILLRFDLSSLPAGIDIQHATLQLKVQGRSDTVGLPVAAYRLRRSWSEDTATWLQADNGVPWASPGASDPLLDRYPDPLDVTTLDQIAASYQWDITNAVQDWQEAPTANEGLILATAGDTPTIYMLYSSESVNFDLRPKLVVEYVSQPATATPTATDTPTATPTPGLPTTTPTPTATATSTPTPTLTPTPSDTDTVTPTPTATPFGLAVDQAIEASCDQGYEGDTRTWPARVTTYTSCRPAWPESGPEAIYRLNLDQASDLSVQLVYAPDGTDLDIFLLAGSTPDSCLAGEDASLVRSQFQPGAYYLVVDGYQGSAGHFHLQIACGNRVGLLNYLPIYLRSH